MLMLFSWAVALLVIVAVYAVLKRNNLTRHENLPPGSMGFPFLGEVRQFFGSSPPCTLSPFMEERIQRYGPIFKTCLLGKPMIVSADAGFNHFLFQHQDLFKIWSPGASLLLGSQGDEWESRFHKYLRQLPLPSGLFSPKSLKQTNFLSELDHYVAAETLSEAWLSRPTLDIKEAIFNMIFNIVGKRLFSHDSIKVGGEGRDIAKHFMGGTDTMVSYFARRNSFFNILEGRKKLKKVLEREMEERLQSKQRKEDLLDMIMQELKKDDTLLTKEMGMEIIFLLLFVGIQGTTASATLAVKFLTDHPDVVERLSEEQDWILSERKKDGRSCISWEEYKSMTYTEMVIKETLRFTTNPVFRQSIQDINFKGYTIPKGWPVLVHLHSVHMDPNLFPDPFSFNPSRWEDAKAGAQGYMPFGGGRTLCLGMDLSKLFMTLFLHHLVTEYRWKTVKGGEATQKMLTMEFPNGFHIQLSPRKRSPA